MSWILKWMCVGLASCHALRIAVVGDAGEVTASQRRSFAQINAASPDVVLTTGDNVYEHGLAAPDVESEARIWGALRARPLWGVPGNHDHRGDPTALSFVPSRNYERWLAPDVQLLAIDSTPLLFPNTSYWNPRGLASNWVWLEAQMRAPKPPWRIVLAHHPIHSATKHCNEQREAKSRLDRVLGGAFDLYLSGHTHCFEKCYGQTYVTVGSTSRLNDVHTSERANQLRRATRTWVGARDD